MSIKWMEWVSVILAAAGFFCAVAKADDFGWVMVSSAIFGVGSEIFRRLEK